MNFMQSSVGQSQFASDKLLVYVLESALKSPCQQVNCPHLHCNLSMRVCLERAFQLPPLLAHSRLVLSCCTYLSSVISGWIDILYLRSSIIPMNTWNE